MTNELSTPTRPSGDRVAVAAIGLSTSMLVVSAGLLLASLVAPGGRADPAHPGRDRDHADGSMSGSIPSTTLGSQPAA